MFVSILRVCVSVVSVVVALLAGMLVFGAMGGMVLAMWDVAIGMSTVPHALLVIAAYLFFGLAAVVVVVGGLRVHEQSGAALI